MSETPGFSFPQYHKFLRPEALGDSDWQWPIIQHQLLEKYGFLFLLILQKKKNSIWPQKKIFSVPNTIFAHGKDVWFFSYVFFPFFPF